jgi:glycosyltransferase involved in cell wall biosynthesis
MALEPHGEALRKPLAWPREPIVESGVPRAVVSWLWCWPVVVRFARSIPNGSILKRIASIGALAIAPEGRALIARCAALSDLEWPLLVQAAQVLLARRSRRMVEGEPQPIVLVPHLSASDLELRAVPRTVAERLGLLAAARQDLARAAAMDLRSCTLVIGEKLMVGRSLAISEDQPLPDLGRWLARETVLVTALILGRQEPLSDADSEAELPQASTHYFAFLETATRQPDLSPLLHDIDCRRSGRRPAPPFDRIRPNRKPTLKRQRSVLFLHNNYYQHFYLAQALRRRGWDALCVSLEPPNGSNAPYYHGEDLSLWDPDPDRFNANLHGFYDTIPNRFALVHLYGQGSLGVFPDNWENHSVPRILPWDMLELKRAGVRLSYTPSGCLDGVSQTAVRDFTRVCRKCVWELQPDVCSDARNLAWAKKIDLVCDMIALESDWPLEARQGAKYLREPLTTALDPELWRPDLVVPAAQQIPRSTNEVIIFHAVGNYEQRRRNDRDIKGTGAVFAAVEQLQREGLPVRLEFVSQLPSTKIRFVQVQADIVVDQLNYGRYGASAREAMMLGKPTICYIDPREPDGLPPNRAITECPLVSATEETLIDVLRDLVLSSAKRAEIGRRSRDYALKWHSAEACAARFEAVYDRLISGLPLQARPPVAAA